MSSKFTPDGKRLTLTFLHIDNCQVVGQKTIDRDGYNAVVVGAVLKKPYKVSKSMKQVFANAKVEPKSKLKEFRVSENHMLDVGLELKPSHFEIGQFVDVSGTSIGKGFAGVMKRHNFRGLEASHGVSVSHRSHGSTGQRQDPGKTFRGKKMAGHMGVDNITVKNLEVLIVDKEKSVIAVKGSIPGNPGGDVVLKITRNF